MSQLKYQQIKEWLKKEALKPKSQKKMPTIREIQRRFGVSQAPVSRALQELESTGVICRKQGVGITAARHNRKQTVTRETNLNGSIFWVYPMYQSELQRKMLHIFEQSALQEKMELCQYSTKKGETYENFFKAIASTDNLRGIIISTGADRLSQDVVCKFGSLNVPVVLTDNLFKYEFPKNVYSLSSDMYSRGYITVKYLHQKGHTSIGIIRNEPLDDAYKDYQNGVKDAVYDLDNQVQYYFFATSIKSWEDSVEAAQKVTIQNLESIRENGITALIYYSTAGAFAAIQTLCEAGFKVPEEISIVGGAEYWYTKYSNPALTCISCDYFQMQRDAFTIASNEDTDFMQTKLYPLEVIERKSVMDYNK